MYVGNYVPTVRVNYTVAQHGAVGFVKVNKVHSRNSVFPLSARVVSITQHCRKGSSCLTLIVKGG